MNWYDKEIRVGDRLITKNAGDAHAMQVLKVVKVDGDGPDGVITYEYLVGRVYNPKGSFKKKQPIDTGTCRMWWAREYCLSVRTEGGHTVIAM